MKETSAKAEAGKKKKVQGFQVLEDECIWMKAGVVSFRICDNAYDCYNCPFDRGMTRAMALGSSARMENRQPDWVKHLCEENQGLSRPCRHALTGRISMPKICPMNYECHHCAYDQMLDELDIVGLHDSPDYKYASGYKMAQGYYYHRGHTWARFEHGGRVRIGFDDFIGKVLGTFDRLFLPPWGSALKQNQTAWSLARGEHKADVFSPVTGTVLAINYKIQQYPEIINQDPYHDGWLLILEPDMPKRDLKCLYFGREAFQWMEKENQELLALMGQEYEALAATGGEPINDIFGFFPEVGWDNLVTKFLRTKSV